MEKSWICKNCGHRQYGLSFGSAEICAWCGFKKSWKGKSTIAKHRAIELKELVKMRKRGLY
jgi:ribosomal protein L37E